MGIRVAFLLNCPLVLSLLKHKGVGAFLKSQHCERCMDLVGRVEQISWNSPHVLR